MQKICAAILVLCLFLCSCKTDDNAIAGGELIIENSDNIIRMSVYNIDSFNPVRTASRSAAQMLSLIYEPLFYHGEDLRPESGLAERAETSEDRMHVSVFLTSGVQWQDASAFCADDVVYTINEIKNGASLYKHNVEHIASAEAAGNSVVTLTLSEPVMNVEGLLSFPIIKSGSSAAIENTPNGTGAFKVEEKTASRIYLKQNEKYHSDTGSVNGVNVRIMRDSAACVNAFEANELDVITSSEIDLGQKTPGGDIFIKNYTSNRFTFLGFNHTLSKYAEPYLRQVIAEMLDRSKIIENALYGRGAACTVPINPSAWFNIETAGPTLDIEGAMNKAGYSKNDGIYENEQGELAQVSILVSEENAQKLAAAELIASQLEYAGISAAVESVQFDEYKRRVSAKNFDLFIGEILMKDNLDPGIMTEPGNYFGYSSQELNDAVSKLRQSRNDEELASSLLTYEQVFFAQMPFVPLYYSFDGVVYNSSLSGIEAPSFYNGLAGLEKWYFKALAE